MKNNLINVWSRTRFKKPPYVLTGDEEIKDNQNVQKFTSYSDFIKSAYINNRKTIHLGLLPIPYLGDLAKAKILILLLNPGFEPIDYFAEYKSKAYRKAIINNIKQKYFDNQYPFLPLNPRFLWTGGGRYWSKKFAGITEEIMRKKRCSYQQALSHISKRVAIIEYFPYHSNQFAISKKIIKKLVSPKMAVDYVKNILKPRAKNGEILILVARKADVWELKRSKNVIIFNGSETRAAHLGKYKNKILDKLLKP